MIPAALLVALLTLPFHPFWMDMELARRGWLLCIVGVLLALRPRRLLGPLDRVDLLFLGFLLWSALGALGASSGWDAVYRLAHLTALFAAFRAGRSEEPIIWLRAMLPTAIAISAYGMFQGLGLEWPSNYANAAAPVSTLGNLNVASEFTAVGLAAAVVLLWRGERALPATALILGTAYLVVNGSRSGMVAAPMVLLWVAVTVRGQMNCKVLALSLGLLGAGLGLVVPQLVSSAEDVPHSTAPEFSTIEVRQEIWKGSWQMAAEAPFLGQGPGQFSVEYARFRTQREIELSTNERQFPASPRTAHNDPLEILAEGGWPGLLLSLGLIAAASLAIYRSGMSPYLAPLLAFCLLSLVRSPLGNAPVSAWIMVYLGSLLPIARAESVGTRIWGARALGTLLLVAGVPVLVSQTLAAPYLAARPNLQEPDPQHLQRALSWTSFDPRLHELLVQENLNKTPPALADAREHLISLAGLTPHSPFSFLMRIQEALLSGDLDRAQIALDRLRDLDPGNIEAATLQSTVHFRRGDHQAAIEAVYRVPHWRLREALPDHMRQLGDGVKNTGDTVNAKLYECEGVFLTALERLRQVRVAQSAVQDVVRCFGEAGRLQQDIRPWVLLAIQFHGLDNEAEVVAMAEEAGQRSLRLEPVYRDLFGELLEPLLEVEAWRALIQ